MKTRYLLLIFFGTMIITGIGISAGYYFNQLANKDDNSSESKTDTTTKPSGTSTLRVKGDRTPENGAILEPNQFFQYEDYANSAGSLFQDIVVGDGTEIASGDTATVVYTGWLTNGQVFDQSKTNRDGEKEPFTFTIGAGQVIPGWEQAIIGMKAGGKRRLIVPSAFGYGNAESDNIPANSMLIFDVELLRVDKGGNGLQLGL